MTGSIASRDARGGTAAVQVATQLSEVRATAQQLRTQIG